MRGQLKTELTSREMQVLLLTAEALEDSQIAERLGINIMTVRRHSFEVKNKLGLDNRVAMALYAVRKGLIQP